MVNSEAFATFEPGLASQKVLDQVNTGGTGYVGQRLPSGISTDLLAVGAVLGVLYLLEHLRPKR